MRHPDLPVPGLEWAFHVDAALGPLEDHGMTRVGHRRIIPVVSGTVTGEIEAELLSGGADWQIVRPDGAIEVDGRYSARTGEGELIYFHAVGIRSGAPDVLEALLRGSDVDPAKYYFRTMVTIETSSPRLAHLQHALFIASARRQANSVQYDAYRLS